MKKYEKPTILMLNCFEENWTWYLVYTEIVQISENFKPKHKFTHASQASLVIAKSQNWENYIRRIFTQVL